ncbi:MAG: hypothetical protein RIC55_30580 [Pirellulaceae bacterium]
MTHLLDFAIVRLALFVGLVWVLLLPVLLVGAACRKKRNLVRLTGPFFASYACVVLLLVLLGAGFFESAVLLCFVGVPLCGFAWTLALRGNR